jgi:antitoxin ParD1/3/4
MAVSLDPQRATKIASVQRLVDEARASGLSDKTMDEIRADALRQAKISPAHQGKCDGI